MVLPLSLVPPDHIRLVHLQLLQRLLEDVVLGAQVLRLASNVLRDSFKMPWGSLVTELVSELFEVVDDLLNLW